MLDVGDAERIGYYLWKRFYPKIMIYAQRKEDLQQTFRLAYYQYKHDSEGEEDIDALRKRIRMELNDLLQNTGLRIPFEAPKHKNMCGIPGCGKQGWFRNDKYDYLCRRHGDKLRTRIRRGWSDPYKGIEDEYNHEIPRAHRAFWTEVKKSISQKEWNRMWEWAKHPKNREYPRETIKHSAKQVAKNVNLTMELCSTIL